MQFSHVSSASPQPRSMARSLPIAIKGAPDVFALKELDDEREECEKRFYEGATWRMYNRIVDHRLNSPPSQSPAPVYYHYHNDGQSPSPCSVPSPQPAMGISPHNNSASPVPTGLVRPQARYARPCPTPFMPMMTMMDSTSSSMEDNDLDDEVFDFEL